MVLCLLDVVDPDVNVLVVLIRQFSVTTMLLIFSMSSILMLYIMMSSVLVVVVRVVSALNTCLVLLLQLHLGRDVLHNQLE